jgi:hypothetical protein
MKIQSLIDIYFRKDYSLPLSNVIILRINLYENEGG